MAGDEERGSRAVRPISGPLVLAHLLPAGRCGIFRDELYYVAWA